MAINILKLDPTLKLTEETHPDYGTSFSFPISGKANFKSTAINVEHNGKLYQMILFNKKTDTVMENGKHLYIPAVALKPINASVAEAVEAPKQSKIDALTALVVKQQEQMVMLMEKLTQSTGLDTAKVAVVKPTK